MVDFFVSSTILGVAALALLLDCITCVTIFIKCVFNVTYYLVCNSFNVNHNCFVVLYNVYFSTL